MQYIEHYILFLFVLKMTSRPWRNLIYMVLEVHEIVDAFLLHLWVLLTVFKTFNSRSPQSCAFLTECLVFHLHIY